MSLDILSFTPTSGNTDEYVMLNVMGMAKDYTTENIKVYLGEERVHDILAVNPEFNTVSVRLSENARTGAFSVQGPDMEYVTSAGEFTVNGDHDTKPPILSSVTRAGGGTEYKPADRATLNGRNLQGVQTLFVGTKTTPIGNKMESKIVFAIPVLRPGSYQIKVRGGDDKMYTLTKAIIVGA